jgi:sugar-specific transcriptional regulator TrmB
MNTESTLKRMRLSGNQVHVYLAALELGEASITEISRKSGLKRATTHLLVEELEVLDLISSVVKGKRRKFSAVHPRRLLQLARSVEREVEEILPELLALYNKAEYKPRIQVFEGQEGVRAMYRDLYASLNNRNEMVGFTRIDGLREAPGAIGEYKKVLRQVTNPKIRELNSGPQSKEWAEELKHLRGKNHQMRILPEKFPFGFSDNLIYENKLVIFSIKKDVFVIVIESGEIVKTYKALFEWAWLQGEEV